MVYYQFFSRISCYYIFSQIKLADKQAAVEKLQWEAKTSNQKAERLQEELDSMQFQISSLTHIFEGLSKDDAVTSTEDYDVTPYYVDHLSDIVSQQSIYVFAGFWWLSCFTYVKGHINHL